MTPLTPQDFRDLHDLLDRFTDTRLEGHKPNRFVHPGGDDDAAIAKAIDRISYNYLQNLKTEVERAIGCLVVEGVDFSRE